MTTHTFKSASGTPEASSPSGTSAKTGATAGRAKKLKRAKRYKSVLVLMKGMSDKKFSESMVKFGIVTKGGSLTTHYLPKKKPKKTVKA